MKNLYQTLGFLLVTLSFTFLQIDLMGQDTINVPGDQSTIQAAIDAASGGEIILVEPGEYDIGNGPISINKPDITLKSEVEHEAVIVGSATRAIQVSVNDPDLGTITIEGFTIKAHRRWGIEINDSQGTTAVIKNNKLLATNPQQLASGGAFGIYTARPGEITGNYIEVSPQTFGAEGDRPRAGIGLRGTGSVLVEDNTIQWVEPVETITTDIETAGIRLKGKNKTIKDNTINGTQYGIRIEKVGAINPRDNVIKDNTITWDDKSDQLLGDDRFTGIFFRHTTFGDITIEGNSFENLSPTPNCTYLDATGDPDDGTAVGDGQVDLDEILDNNEFDRVVVVRDSEGDIEPRKFYAKVQTAIDVASAGDEIEVDAGLYEERLLIWKDVTILGPNHEISPNNSDGTSNSSRVAEAVITPPSNEVNGVLVYNGASGGVVLSGFTIDYPEPTGDNDVNWLIRVDESNVTIKNNIINSHANNGAFFSNSSNTSGVLTNNVVENNRISNESSVMAWGSAIAFNNSANLSQGPSNGHIVRGNVITKSQNRGILLSNSHIYALVENNFVYDSRIGVQTGLNYAANVVNGDIVPLTIRNNHFDVSQIGVWQNYDVNNASGWLIEGNEISFTNPVSTPTMGVYVLTQAHAYPNSDPINGTLKNNTIDATGADYGYVFQQIPTEGDLVVEGGSVSNAGIAGVFVTTDGFNSSADPFDPDKDSKWPQQFNVSLQGVTLSDNNIGIFANRNEPGETEGTSSAGVFVGRENVTLTGNTTPIKTTNGALVGGDVQVFSEAGDFKSAHNTIQDAIDAADPGDVIKVAAGTYEEKLTIDVNDLTIKSVEEHQATIDVSGESYPGILVTAEDVTIQDFTIIGIANTGGLSNNELFTIQAEDGSSDGLTVDNNIFNAPDEEKGHIALRVSGDVDSVSFTNNVVNDYVAAIVARNDADNFNQAHGATNFTISDNEFNIDYVISGNNSRGRAIEVHVGDDINVIDNVMTFNLDADYEDYIENPPGTGAQSTNNGGFISFHPNADREGDILIEGNTISNFRRGIAGTGSDATISNNTFHNNHEGIRIGQSSPSHTTWSGGGIIISNQFTENNTGIKIQDGDGYDLDIENNSFVDNVLALNNNQDDEVVDATCNWWGTTDAGEIADAISGDVDFFPWLTDGTDDEPGEPGFTPVAGACDAEVFVQLDDSEGPTCPGGSDGSIDVTVSEGQAPYSFSWTGPDGFSSTDQNITELSAGVYSLTVTDDASNTAEFSTEIFDPEDEVEVTQVDDMGPLCAGDQLEISFDASGLGSSHTFEWTNDNTEIGPANGSGDIDFPLENNTPDAQTGTFSVVATSDLGCESDPMTFEVTVACATISGTIEDLDGIAMEGVTVNMSGDDTQATTTNSDGEYTFDQAVGTSFVIEPDTDFGPSFSDGVDLESFGVTANDATTILNHINGSQVLTGKPLISADTRTTDNVTGADRAAVIVGLLGNPIAINFWNTQSWYFIEEGHEFNNPALPWDYASSIEVVGANGDIEDVDFQGIRKGDITSAVTAVDDFYSGPSRSGNVVNMVMEEQDLQPGQTVEVDVRFSDLESITSMQFAVEFDQNALELSEVITRDMLPEFDQQNVGLYALNQGIIRVVWATSSDNAQTLSDEDVVFTLVFESKAAEGSKLSETLDISETDISALAFTDVAEMPIVALFDEALSTGDIFGDGTGFTATAQPNPFSDQTSIRLNMAQAGQVDFEIYTADGKLVSYFTRDLPTGEAEVILDDQKMDGPGMYFIHLRTEEGTTVLRLINTDR